jgi:serine protease
MLRVVLATAVAIGSGPAFSAWAAGGGPATGRRALPASSGAGTVDQLILRYSSEAMVSAQAMPELPAGLEVASQTLGVELEYVRAMAGGAHVIRLVTPLDPARAQTLIAQLESFPNVAYAEPDRWLRPATLPDDPRYVEQWNLSDPAAGVHGVGAEEAWAYTTGDTDLVIAVVDTGIRTNHEEFAGRLLPGYDFIANIAQANDSDGRDPDPADPGDSVSAGECGPFATASSWHGTHVAGILGATGNNTAGVAGLNWSSRLLPVRVLGKCGGRTSDIVDGVLWAAGLAIDDAPLNPHPARIINLSLGGEGPCSNALADMVTQARMAGAILVTAAGNSGSPAGNFAPGNCPGVVNVAATNRAGSRASYSNYDGSITLSAPGGDFDASILSTVDSGSTGPVGPAYAGYVGTSMAAPHVAGVLSLLLSAQPALSADDAVWILRATTTAFPADSTCSPAQCGSGIVHAGRALRFAATMTQRQFLPGVFQAHQPGIGLLPDGDFEQGGAWNEAAASGLAIIGYPSGWLTAHSGGRMAYFGDLPAETGWIEQTVSVPVGASRLTFWHVVRSEDPDPGGDYGRIRIDGVVIHSLDFTLETDRSSWAPLALDVSRYAGRAIRLRFEHVTDDDSWLSSWYIDDVAWAP